MTDTTTEVKCALAIFSADVEVAEMTARIGIAPTIQRTKGDPIRPGATVASHQWIWQPPDAATLSMDEQLDAIWSVLGPRANEIASLAPACKVVLDFEINHHEDDLDLGWVLDARHVAAAAAFGAWMDFDEYNYAER